MSTLYITDLDGTFLDNEARVSPVSAATVTRLSHIGAMISVATARTPATVVPLLADTYTTAELVVMTGAALWDRPGACFDNLRLIPRSQAGKVIAGFDGSGISPFIYTLSGRTMLHVFHRAAVLSQPEATFVRERSHLTLKRFYLNTEAPSQALDSMILAFAMGAEGPIRDVAARLEATTECHVSFYKDTYTPDLWLLEVFAAGVSKAGGVERLRRSCGATRVVAFGDNLNDIPMLRAADVGVAVANALPQVKDAADIVIGPNTDDAVARFIEEDFNKQCHGR